MDYASQPSDRPNAASGPAVVPAADEVDWTGQVLGQFRILHRLGSGGMGQVYLAEQTNLKRKVALKLLHSELASNERALVRFQNEAENVARATHANIVQIYDIGKDNGVNWLALEYVEGRNLREFIEKKGTPELSLGLHIMAQVASALQRASEFGIIHRDIKPENILLTKKGEVKVADFGLSRCFAEEAKQSVTQSLVTMGTPLYMSPEQVERKTVDTRTDIYSFGVTCYHMFAGTPPYRGNSPIEVAYQHVHGEPPPLAEIRPDLPPVLCAILQRMMAKKPEDRYQSAREIMRDINQLREALNLGAVANISMSSSFLGKSGDAWRTAPTPPCPETGPRRPMFSPAVMSASVLLALAGGLGFGWMQHLRRQPVRDLLPAQPLLQQAFDAKEKKPSFNEREKELQQRVQEHLKPEIQLDVNSGLKACADLGLFYLKHRQFKEADAFFEDIRKPDRKVPAYRFLGQVGHAMVLAFQDENAASNREFLEFFANVEKLEARTGPLPKKANSIRNENEAYRLLWKDNYGSIREMAARALSHNHANDPTQFPAKLEAYRFPPRPTLKALPTTM